MTAPADTFEGGRFVFVFGAVPAITVDVMGSGEGWVSGELAGSGDAGEWVRVNLASVLYARGVGA